MYLPDTINKAEVFITVKTYPLPSYKYEELVCTAGILRDGKWIRIYPIPYRSLAYTEQYKKYNWVQIDLVKQTKDFRPESYRPRLGLDEEFKILNPVGTQNHWRDRKEIILQDVEESMSDLIVRAKGEEKKSLATVKPLEIIDFVYEEDEREWKKEWRDHLLQKNIFTNNEREIIKKLPYKFFYKFITKGDSKPRKLMIEDWEIGALYWNVLKDSQGDEQVALQKVRQKYFDEFVNQKDLFFFVGTTKQYHNIGPNPFVIIGVFYPPKNDQPDFIGRLI